MIYGGINMTAMIANSLGLNLNGGWLNEWPLLISAVIIGIGSIAPSAGS